MDKQKVIFKDLGIIEYKAAWDYQEVLLQQNVNIKSAIRNSQWAVDNEKAAENNSTFTNYKLQTTNYFLLCEHPPVYTLGKSGKKEHVLMTDEELEDEGEEEREGEGLDEGDCKSLTNFHFNI